MSVELLDSPRFYGYRVRRQIEGKTYQEYFPLKKAGKRLRGAGKAAVKLQAITRDAELDTRQRTHRETLAKQVHIEGKGKVRGILCRLKAEKSGTQTPVFQVGIKSEFSGKIVNTSVSINRYGIREAWMRAVTYFAKHKQISKRSRAYKDLMAAEPSPLQVRRMTRCSVKR